MGPRALLLALWGSILSSALDLDSPIVFSGDADGAFGASVGTLVATDGGGVLVGAPRQRLGGDRTGRIFWCRSSSGTCQEVPVPGAKGAINASLGLTVAVGDEGALVCGPTSTQPCGENLHLPGFCVFLDTNLQQLRRFPPSPPGCPQRASDIVFLIDGSGSIKPREFQEMKKFVEKVMENFKGSNTQFSLTQFSDLILPHFDFRTFRSSSDPTQLLGDVLQLGGRTHTASAIHDVLTRSFTEAAGAREEALKILIVITDGRKFKDSLEYEDVIPEAEKMGVIRYAIGVGRSFSHPDALQELLTISSPPGHDHVFRVDNFQALQGIQDQLQDKIFSLEGTSLAQGSSFQLEMSQEGFSATITPEGPLLGSVGAYSWSGGAWLYGSSGDVTWLNASHGGHQMDNSYLGYAAESLLLGGHQALALGAPRSGHLGRLLLFQRRGTRWDLLDEASGTQVGGAFGASLLALDTDGDGSAELLLVGSPLFFGSGSGGRVDLCDLHPEAPRLRCSRVLRGDPGHPLGRFGSSLALVGDVDGDRWPEVAVGAPLEDQERGAVYIFQGSWRGVQGRYSQRISGSRFSTRLFGRALSGGRDVTGDLLPDLAVGAQGRVLLLRARPRLEVQVNVTFQPQEVPVPTGERCRGEDTTPREVAKATICFVATKGTNDNYGPRLSAEVPFRVRLEPASRLVSVGGSELSGTETVSLGRRCRSLALGLLGCPRDTRTPLRLRLSYGYPEPPQGQRVALRPPGQTDVTATLPFSRGCAGPCRPDLHLSLSRPSHEPLVVGVAEALDVTLGLVNRGHEAPGATVRLLHGHQLALRRAHLLQASGSPGSLRCRSEEPLGRTRSTLCLLDPDGFRAGAEVTFALSLFVPPEAELGLELELVATASSSDEEPGGPGQRVHVPVRYGVVLLLASPPNSSTFVPVPRDVPHVPISHLYELQIRGSRGPPLNVTFQVPSGLGGTRLWGALTVTPLQPELARCQEGPEIPGDPNIERRLQDQNLLDCSVASCLQLLCSVPPLQPPHTLGFSLQGSLALGWIQQPRVVLKSSARVAFDEGRYWNSAGSGMLEVQTLLERPEPPQPLPYILVGAAVGLVLLALGGAALWKAGFFRRRYRELLGGAGPGEPQE
ncbi:integrin alpha-D-like [Phaenicophaeus curvirostris]|uniref:integrin alpha-D-like n=1 Tax=Phaenicophaeus curvirostris TaxID=33595 RepID=UPI0037F100C2